MNATKAAEPCSECAVLEKRVRELEHLVRSLRLNNRAYAAANYRMASHLLELNRDEDAEYVASASEAIA